MKRINLLVILIFMLTGCSTKQYQYGYSLASDSHSWDVSTNLFCLIGSESRMASKTVGPEVKSPNDWEDICDAQFDGKPSITLTGSSLPSARTGILVAVNQTVNLIGQRGKMNAFGQCETVEGRDVLYDCLKYETAELMDFSSLSPAFYVDIEGQKNQRLNFKLERQEAIHY